MVMHRAYSLPLPPATRAHSDRFPPCAAPRLRSTAPDPLRMFETVRIDLTRACRANQNNEQGFAAVLRELCNPGTQAIVVYRFGYWADNLRFPPFRIILRLIHFVLQYFCWRTGIFIPVKARIGPGMVIHTWGGGVFIPNATIGRNLTIVGG